IVHSLYDGPEKGSNIDATVRRSAGWSLLPLARSRTSEVGRGKKRSMPAHYIAQANREKLGISGMEKIVAFDQSQSLDDFMGVPELNNTGTPPANGVVTFPGNIRKKA